MTAKKRMAVCLFPVLVCLTSMIFLNGMWQRTCQKASYHDLSAFCQIVLENDPESEALLLSSLKEYRSYAKQGLPESGILEAHGYTAKHFSGNAGRSLPGLVLTASVLMLAAYSLSIFSILRAIRVRIASLTNYLEQVNTDSPGTILQIREDEFSHLQDEIYKTVTNLSATKNYAITAKESFADNLANIAHQLKTPLTAALLSLQMMKQETPNPYAEPVEKQLKRLNQLEEILLTLSGIDSGALPLEHSPVDLYTVLTLAAENLTNLLADKSLQIEIPDKGCVEICGDMEWTMEALINLIKNCIEHSPPSGTIHCDYSENPLYKKILIWDEGPGFDREDLPYLFSRFYRGKNASKDGTGIGLALAHSIFELQNGNLSACNLPGGGACFEIRIYPASL